MKLIRILYFAGWGEFVGGGPISLFNLVKGLDRKRFEPVVVCPKSGSLSDALRDLNIKTRIFETKKLIGLGFFSFIPNLIKLLKLVKKEKINIIHSNAAASRESIYAGVTSRLTRLPFIYHVRIFYPIGFIERLIFKLSTKVIVISEAVRKNIAPFVKKDKIERVYNGVDLNKFRPDMKKGIIRHEFTIKSKTKIVGTVGRLSTDKGYEHILEAFSLIKKRLKEDIKLLVVGEDIDSGKEYQKFLIRKTKEFNLSSDVIFTGYREDIPEILTDLDVFVHYCETEAFGRVIIEAMAMAKPVVSIIDSGGVPEIVEDGKTGILVPPKNPEAMSSAVIDLLKKSEKMEEMGKKGRKRVERLFSIEKHLSGMEEIYKEVMPRE